jgi:hypothetical protein
MTAVNSMVRSRAPTGEAGNPRIERGLPKRQPIFKEFDHPPRYILTRHGS